MNKVKENGYMYDLINKAKDGDKISRSIIIEDNIPLINKIANNAYSTINRLYQQKNGTNLPDNIISKEDVVQDFYTKAVYYFNHYLKEGINVYYSVYLNNMLVSYSRTYCKRTLSKLFRIYDYEEEHNIDNRFIKILDKKNDEEIKDELLEMSNLDFYMSKYQELINIIFKYSSFSAIEEATGLSKRYVTRRINQFAELYNTRKEQILITEHIEELIKKISDIDDDYFKELCCLYDDIITKQASIIHEQIRDIDLIAASNISISDLKGRIIIYIYDCVLKYRSREYCGVDVFSDFLKLKLCAYKVGYLKKFNHLLQSNRMDDKHLKIKKLK